MERFAASLMRNLELTHVLRPFIPEELISHDIET
jgi:hypothetical protein